MKSIIIIEHNNLVIIQQRRTWSWFVSTRTRVLNQVELKLLAKSKLPIILLNWNTIE